MDIIQIIVNILGVGVIIFFQNKKINALNTRINAQSGIIADINLARQILDPKLYRDYIDMTECKYKLQIEQEKETIKKSITREVKANINYLTSQYMESLASLIRIVSYLPANPAINDILEKMPEGHLRNLLIETRDEARVQWDSIFSDSNKKGIVNQVLSQLAFTGALGMLTKEIREEIKE
jgi:hypothetical protein